MKTTWLARVTPMVAAAGMLAASAGAAADTFSFESVVGTEDSGITYTGSFDVTGSTLTLNLVLDPNGVEGFLTAIVFNQPDDAITGQTSAPTADFEFVSDGLSAFPYGQFDVGSALHGAFLGGGSPNGGVALADGVTAQWTFSLASDDFSAADFWDPTCTNRGCFSFVARFRGLDTNEGSDKIPAVPTPIPEPGTYALILAGLGAIGFVARRRRPH